MKPSQTALEALRNTPVVRTRADATGVLANVLTALLRKEISATDATAAVAVTDGMCNLVNTEIKAMRLQLEMRKAGAGVVELLDLGQMVLSGEAK